MSLQKIIAWCVIVFLFVGCGGPKPPAIDTFETTGVITYKDGTPAAGCIVQFSSESSPGLNMSAVSEEDGSFALVTLHENDNLPGAVAGPCRVSITLPIVNPIPTIFDLKKVYEIKEAEDNHFEITLGVLPQA